MSAFRLSEPAQDDLVSIAEYLADEDPAAAHRLLDLLESAMERLAEIPGLGHSRHDLTDEEDLLFWTVQRYLIVYRAASRPLEVVRILHGSRDARTQLGRR